MQDLTFLRHATSDPPLSDQGAPTNKPSLHHTNSARDHGGNTGGGSGQLPKVSVALTCVCVFTYGVHVCVCAYVMATCLRGGDEGQIASSLAGADCFLIGRCRLLPHWQVQIASSLAGADCFLIGRGRLLPHWQGQIAFSLAGADCFLIGRGRLLPHWQVQ